MKNKMILGILIGFLVFGCLERPLMQEEQVITPAIGGFSCLQSFEDIITLGLGGTEDFMIVDYRDTNQASPAYTQGIRKEIKIRSTTSGNELSTYIMQDCSMGDTTEFTDWCNINC